MNQMKPVLAALGALTALAWLAPPCAAQVVIRMARGGGVMLLSSKAVQKELKLTPEQITKAEERIKTFQEEMQEQFAQLHDAAPEEREELIAKMQEKQNKAAKELLKEDQRKRFDQLSLQSAGPNAFEQKEVAKRLELTSEQKDKIKTLLEEHQETMRGVIQDNPGNGDEIGKKIQELNPKTLKSILATLTEKQQKQWKEMTGEPFKFEAPKIQIRHGDG